MTLETRLFLIVLLCLHVAYFVAMGSKLGGWSETQEATDETQKIYCQVKDDVEKRTGKKYVEFKAVKYRRQVVAGENYLTKVHVGGSSYLHLKVFQELPCNGGKIVLCDVQEDYCKEDPLVPL